MKFRMLLAAVAVAAIMPVAASAEDGGASDKENGARACEALKASLGDATFKATYGTTANRTNAFGKCVSKWTHTERKNRQEAATACAAEQADPNFAATHGGKTFDLFYGVGKRGAAAMQHCVNAKRKAASATDRKETMNAAKQCKAERKLDGAAFKTKYGTTESKSNAFGKCVSKLAQAQQDG